MLGVGMLQKLKRPTGALLAPWPRASGRLVPSTASNKGTMMRISNKNAAVLLFDLLQQRSQNQVLLMQEEKEKHEQKYTHSHIFIHEQLERGT